MLRPLPAEMVRYRQDVDRQQVRTTLAPETEDDEVLIVDDIGLATPDRHPGGAARRHSGTLGKVGNCRGMVGCRRLERTLALPAVTRLYPPPARLAETPRRTRGRVPASPRHGLGPPTPRRPRGHPRGVFCPLTSLPAPTGQQ